MGGDGAGDAVAAVRSLQRSLFLQTLFFYSKSTSKNKLSPLRFFEKILRRKKRRQKNKKGKDDFQLGYHENRLSSTTASRFFSRNFLLKTARCASDLALHLDRRCPSNSFTQRRQGHRVVGLGFSLVELALRFSSSRRASFSFFFLSSNLLFVFLRSSSSFLPAPAPPPPPPSYPSAAAATSSSASIPFSPRTVVGRGPSPDV